MEREIKFRAFRVDGKGWVYGYYWRDNTNGKHKITVDLSDDNFTCHEVIPESVGQYTGLKDRNGVEIYEGDILNIGTASFMRGVFGVYPEYSLEFTPLHEWHIVSREIIGNIHEPPKQQTNPDQGH